MPAFAEMRSKSCFSGSKVIKSLTITACVGGVWDAYIRMEGVNEFYEAIRNKVDIQMPLRKQPYGDWEFEVKDPNGYILVFSELID